jgi:hypothetical protein
MMAIYVQLLPQLTMAPTRRRHSNCATTEVHFTF